MVRAERNEYRARASAIDERDLQVLAHLLEHKILTTHQITSLHFRSLRRCQHRMRELKEMGLIASCFPVRRGADAGQIVAISVRTTIRSLRLCDTKKTTRTSLCLAPAS
jgi:hypothetical protein